MQTLQRTSPDASTKRVLNVKEFCHRYCCGRTTFYRFIKEGKLKTFTLGGKRLVRVEDAESFLSEAAR